MNGTPNNMDETQINYAKIYRFTKATWYMIMLDDILERTNL